MTKQQKYFDPETLAKLRPFRLRAHAVVDGLVAGLHRSQLRGHSIEFAQHREYVPGDDLRQVDWKIYARSDRYYLKQYEDETNLVVYVLLDQSRSMQYQGEKSVFSKLEHGQLVAFSLAHLVISQQDSVGFVAFSDGIDDWLEAAGSPAQLDSLIQVMESVGEKQRTNLHDSLIQVAERLAKPSLVFVISDFLDDMPKTLKSVSLLRATGHDVAAIQILDADEISFPFDQATQFEGMEELTSQLADPLMIANAYRAAMRAFQQELSLGCQKVGASYYSTVTNESLGVFLPRLLVQRQLGRS